MRIVTAQEIDAIKRIESEAWTGAGADREEGTESGEGPPEGEEERDTSRELFWSAPLGMTVPHRRPDSLIERAVALIPAAAITVWISLTGLAPQSLGPSVEWITLAVSWVVCVGVLWRTTEDPKNIENEVETEVGNRNRTAQILIPTLMFPFYVYIIGGPFDEFVWYDPAIGTYLLVVIFVLTTVFFPKIASLGLSEN